MLTPDRIKVAEHRQGPNLLEQGKRSFSSYIVSMTDIGAIATLDGIITGHLPDTRSDKVVRRTVRDFMENSSRGSYEANDNVSVPPTIEDLSVAADARNGID